MKEEDRKQLVKTSKGMTLEGSPCNVAGWKNEEWASLTPRFGGFWRASWETVERVLAGDKNFVASDVRLHSRQWAGFGDDVPEALMHHT